MFLHLASLISPLAFLCSQQLHPIPFSYSLELKYGFPWWLHTCWSPATCKWRTGKHLSWVFELFTWDSLTSYWFSNNKLCDLQTGPEIVFSERLFRLIFLLHHPNSTKLHYPVVQCEKWIFDGGKWIQILRQQNPNHGVSFAILHWWDYVLMVGSVFGTGRGRSLTFRDRHLSLEISFSWGVFHISRCFLWTASFIIYQSSSKPRLQTYFINWTPVVKT